MKLIKRLILSAVLLGSSMGSMHTSFAQDSMGSSNSDLALTVLGGAGLASASCYVESPLAKWALGVCAVAPLFAHLVPEKTIKLLNNVPVIGTYLKLSSKMLPCQDGCEGICKQCKVKRLYQFYPLILAPVGLAALLTKPKLTSPSPNPQQTPEPDTVSNEFPPRLVPTSEPDDCLICAEENVQTECPQPNCHAVFHQACWNQWLNVRQEVRQENVPGPEGYFRAVTGEVVDENGWEIEAQIRRVRGENGRYINMEVPVLDEIPRRDDNGNQLFGQDDNGRPVGLVNLVPRRARPHRQLQIAQMDVAHRVGNTQCPACQHDFAQ